MDSPPLVEVSERAPPYFRFLLSSQSTAPSLPAAMETRLPIENWTAFWSRIQPILHRVEHLKTVYDAVPFICIAVLFGLVFYLTAVLGSPFAAFGPALLLVSLFAVIPFVGRMKQARLETIRTFCREEQNAFRRHGFAVECDFEWSTYRSCDLYLCCDLYLYFLPIADIEVEQVDTSQNGYLRMEVLNSSHPVCGWNIACVPDLASNEYPPTGFESLSHNDWAECRSKLIEVSRECQSLLRILVVCYWALVFLILMSVLYILEYEAIIFAILVLAMPLVCVIFGVVWQFGNLIKKQSLIVEEYAKKFAQQGVYMEYRKRLKFHRYCGPYVCYYIYLFPWTNIELDRSNVGLVFSGGEAGTTVGNTTV